MDRDFDLLLDNATPVIVSIKGDAANASPYRRVELDLTRFHSGRWAAQLDNVFVGRDTPAVILAQGVACLAVAWWAQLSPRSYMTQIRGAIFLSPLSIGFGQAGIARNVRASPVTRLPFPSIVACDPVLGVEQVLALADSWGSQFVDTTAPLGEAASNRRAIGSPTEQQLVELLAEIGGRRVATPAAVPEPVVRLAVPAE